MVSFIGLEADTEDHPIFAGSTMEPIILHIDASQAYASLALSAGSEILHSWESAADRAHTVDIPVQTMEILQQSGSTIEDLSAISLCQGPGSYTGLRSSYAWALGLTAFRDITLLHLRRDAILRSMDSNGDVLFHARREDFRYYPDGIASPPEGLSISPTELQELSSEWISDQELPIDLSHRIIPRRAADQLALSLERYPSALNDRHHLPIYFNPPYITTPRTR